MPNDLGRRTCQIGPGERNNKPAVNIVVDGVDYFAELPPEAAREFAVIFLGVLARDDAIAAAGSYVLNACAFACMDEDYPGFDEAANTFTDEDVDVGSRAIETICLLADKYQKRNFTKGEGNGE